MLSHPYQLCEPTRCIPTPFQLSLPPESGAFFRFKTYASKHKDVSWTHPSSGSDSPQPPAQAFTFGDPDFTFRSMIGNAVLRWEYRPGSTVFFVWTQNGTGSDTNGNFDFARERTAIFSDRPTNVFQVKVNFWLGR